MAESEQIAINPRYAVKYTMSNIYYTSTDGDQNSMLILQILVQVLI